MYTPRSGKVLVIGFGNDLCGEDAAGRMVAAQIARWNHPKVEAISVHQLGPEFAQDIAEAHMVIFVDAVPADQPLSELLEMAGIDPNSQQRLETWTDCNDGWTRITHPMLVRLHPAEFGVVLGHAPNPAVLLLMARALFGRSPRSYLVGIPATRFALGDRMSANTKAAMGEAVEMVKGLALWTPRAVEHTFKARQVPAHA